jgi:hypothetical protein
MIKLGTYKFKDIDGCIVVIKVNNGRVVYYNRKGRNEASEIDAKVNLDALPYNFSPNMEEGFKLLNIKDIPRADIQESLEQENIRLREYLDTYATHARTLSRYSRIKQYKPDNEELIQDIEDLFHFRSYVDKNL